MLCPHGLPGGTTALAPSPGGPGTPARPPRPVPPSLGAPGTARDPFPLYRALREGFPVVYDEPVGAWLISRYADVRAALADPRLLASPEPAPPRAGGARTLLHSALREDAFTAGIERVAHVLARRLSGRQEADLVGEFCHWLPAAAAVVVLGLPRGDTRLVRERGRTGAGHWDALLRPHVVRRRTHPRADLLSVLCTARVDGGPLPDETVTALAGTLLDTAVRTGHALASFLANLLDHPGQLELIRARPELVPGAWAESLRRDPPLHVVLRRATERIGVVPAGATVACLPGAAGRDPARFTDPDRYDAFRADPGEQAYGIGEAAQERPGDDVGCPGARLACRTAEHGLRALLDALPHLRWAPGFRPVPKGLLGRSPRSLLVRFS